MDTRRKRIAITATGLVVGLAAIATALVVESDVVLALMGQHDNGYGTAGPAGPVAELVAVPSTRTGGSGCASWRTWSTSTARTS